MDFLLRSFGVLVPIGLLTVPFAVVTWRMLANARGRRQPARAARITAALDVTIVLCAALVLALVTMPFSSGSSLHLVPGTDLYIALTNNNSFWQVTANIGMLLPLGLLLPLRWAWWQAPGRVTAAALTASVGIELMQYVIDTGRVTSTDDVLLNTVGAAAGATLARRTGLNLRVKQLCVPRKITLVLIHAERPWAARAQEACHPAGAHGRGLVAGPRTVPGQRAGGGHRGRGGQVVIGVRLSYRHECPSPAPTAGRRSRTPTG